MAGEFNWGDFGTSAFNAALMLYLQNQNGGGSGSTPNFYNIPLTPEQKYWNDAKKNTYEAGGSPQTQFVRGAGAQFLSQIPSGPSNHSFISPLMAGQTFAGGMKIPTFDLSKLPNVNATPPGVKPSTPTTPPPASGNPSGPVQIPPPPDPLDIPTDGPAPNLPPGLGRNVNEHKRDGTLPEDLMLPPDQGLGWEQNQLPMGNPGATNMAAVGAAWDRWKQAHPNWAALGVNAFLSAATALIGLPMSALAPLFREYLLRNPNAAQPGTGGTIPGSISGQPAPSIPSGGVSDWVGQQPPPSNTAPIYNP